MADTFVTRAPISHGKEDGTQVFLMPGDEVAAELVGDELFYEMRLDGRVVPKSVWDGLVKSVETQAELETAKAQAQAELNKLQSTPAAATNLEAGLAFDEFNQRAERENKKIAQEQGGAELDENGHVKEDVVYPVVTGSTPSPAVSAMAATETSNRETATVKEAIEAQEKKGKPRTAEEIRQTRTVERREQVNAETKTEK
jgi:predicted Zn-dependent peptidase